MNKVSSAVQLRFDVKNSAALSPDLRARLVRLAGRRISREGVLVIVARQHRTQLQNRREAISRLADLVRRAALRPPVRKRTQLPASAHERRLVAKQRAGEKKRLRRPVAGED